MRYLRIALGFEPCPLCGLFNGHQPGCPYAPRRQA